MNMFDTSDPTTVGVLIISALTLAAALMVSRLLRPLERKLAKRLPKPKSTAPVTANHGTGSKATYGELPHRARTYTSSAPQPNDPQNDCAQELSGLQKQWGKIADRLDNDITRIKSAASDHANAETQLHAAEFSLSELFREFPDARDTFNSVTYVDFPDSQSRRTKTDTDPADNNTQVASA